MIDLYRDELDARADTRDDDEWAVYEADQRYELQREAEFDRLADEADERDAALDSIGVYDDGEF